LENQSSENFSALVSIDWADQEHEYAIRRQPNEVREKGKVEHSPEALTEWVMELRKRFPSGSIAICVEQARGALVYFLMRFDFIVLYLINPLTLSKFREALYPSGPKDDPRDTDLLLDLLEKHRDKLRKWNPEPECVRKIDLLNQHRRTIVDDITRLTNRLTACLKGYYPQALALAGNLNTVQACDFLEKWPSLPLLKNAELQQIESFYRKHNCRSTKKISERLAMIKNAIEITDDPAICSVYQMTVKSLVGQLRALLESLEQFNNELANTFEQYPEKDFYQALPGAGPILQPRLAAFFGLNRSKWDQASELQSFSGVAPVTEQSGKFYRWVHWRVACPKFIRQSLVEFANHSRAKSLWAAAYYKSQRDKQKSHQAALRALAYKWLRILFRCWKNSTVYNEQLYLAALEKHNSPLIKLIAQNT
jgi:Transposase/Transposase IS116/IS110/IS902 family